MKSKSTAFILWLFFGLFGGHRFYLGKIGSGILFWLTGGVFLIGWILDLFKLGIMVDEYNARYMARFAPSNTSNNNVNTNNIVVNLTSPIPVQQPQETQQSQATQQ